ncbi:MAG TPA: tetratricopeptide repeat protein [Paludibacteraceae bacterium]|jgi:tetratricopeptide (TPR) repeat protein|nr:tetratricopeptide repeat protein [Paludibacteraceae bacterium]
MKKQLFFALSMVVAIILCSCSKDMGALDPTSFKCTPNPLEAKGGKINATINGTFPVKYFNKNAVVTVTPVLRFQGQEVKSTPAIFQGEKVVGNNKVISYKAGGSYTINASFNYVPEMAKSELYLDFDVTVKDKNYQIPSVKVADGVIATSELATVSASEIQGALIPDKFQRIIQESQDADIKFLIERWDLRPTELKKDEVVSLVNKIAQVKNDTAKKVSNFEIAGYASPDGPIDLNTNLAEKRQKVSVDYINNQIKKLKTSVKIDTKFTPEDWEGFQKLMENSNIQDKEVILRVLSMYSDPEERERQIKNLSVAYQKIAEEILPQLRRSRLKLTVDIIGKSDDQISQLAANNPSQLSVEELLYAATLKDNLNDKAIIYQKVINLYPNDVRGYNNLGLVYYQQNKIDEAEKLFTQALQKDPNSPDVNFNLGLIALKKGDVTKAEELFGKAANTNGEMSKALGTLYLKKGDYAKAMNSFKSNDVSNNVALLYILNNDYNQARKVLSAIPQPDATTAYLSAIVGARTNDRDAVYSNLRTAISKDRSFAQKALNDIEFAKFAADSTFLSILKID